MPEIIAPFERDVVESILPHRDPFIWVSRVVSCEPGITIVAELDVVPELDLFRGHFPTHPVLPGVILMEALAQAGAVAILSLPENEGKVAYFGGIDKCKFKGKVVPGDKVRLETKIIRKKGPIGVGEAVATVDGKKVVSAVLTFAVG